MLSSEALCRKLNEECDLVNVVLASTYFLFSENLAKTMLTLDPIFKYCTSEDDLQNLTRTWEVMVLEQNCVGFLSANLKNSDYCSLFFY